jgi:hypothetical protein
LTDPGAAGPPLVPLPPQTNPTVSLRKPTESETEADATIPGYVATHANTVTVEFEEESGGDSALSSDHEPTEGSIDEAASSASDAQATVRANATDPSTDRVAIGGKPNTE